MTTEEYEMSQASAILGLLTETSLHAGVGQTIDVIDLPIQREAHTNWPFVYGSSVKGSMRTLAKENNYGWIDEVFGQETQIGASEYASALAVSDARLLLLPVRSLTGYFKWVTCPAVLERWQADCRRLRLCQIENFTVPNQFDDETKALISQNQSPKASNLFLEEFRFRAEPTNLDHVINNLVKLMGRDNVASALHKQLTLVNNDMFAHLAKYTTPVNAHIAIDNDTKTVKRGALWYEETLPPDTLLYTALVAQKTRKPKSNKAAKDILGHIINELFPQEHPYLQLGGNETVGMGWCRVKVLRGRDNNADHATTTCQICFRTGGKSR